MKTIASLANPVVCVLSIGCAGGPQTDTTSADSVQTIETEGETEVIVVRDSDVADETDASSEAAPTQGMESGAEAGSLENATADEAEALK